MARREVVWRGGAPCLGKGWLHWIGDDESQVGDRAGANWECLHKWGILPSQMAPNSWRYLVAFVGECRGARIESTRTLFLAYFRLCKGKGRYYMTAHNGFKISGTPSNNKVKEMTKEWLVEARLSLTTRVKLQSVKRTPHGKAVVASSRGGEGFGVGSASQRGTLRRMSGSPKASHLTKRVKTGTRKMYESSAIRVGAVLELSRALLKAEAREAGKERGWPDHQAATPQGGRPPRSLSKGHSTRHWQRISTGPLQRRWWIGRSSHLSRRVIDCLSYANSSLRLEVMELKSGSGTKTVAATEQRASDQGGEVDRLKAELEKSQTRIRMLDDELLTLSHDVKSARSSAWATEQVLKEERLTLPEKIKGTIAEYKSSAKFKRSLVRSGRVTYKFGYRVAYARFRARYPDQELESNPFADQPKDQKCQHADERPL
ncbi:hypothetical protein C4D60_Mb02t01830 [Musa balbisiana]|uniref:Uncharacterized protein n=1 Tax=Musa balbisiana TaxID=52838 RepID=A0A4S8I7J3_MUSBA|nr:hypothetical protein C4D60_Mb02t01830 [Musa balbisiana]